MCGIVLAVTESGLKQSYKVKFLLRPRASLFPFLLCVNQLINSSNCFQFQQGYGVYKHLGLFLGLRGSLFLSLSFFFKRTFLVLSHSLDFSTDASSAGSFALLDHAESTVCPDNPQHIIWYWSSTSTPLPSGALHKIRGYLWLAYYSFQYLALSLRHRKLSKFVG